jgi:hypothetical protein
MPLNQGDKVELLEDIHPAQKGECGLVTTIIDTTKVMVKVTHDNTCNPIPAPFTIGPVRENQLTHCHCP